MISRRFIPTALAVLASCVLPQTALASQFPVPGDDSYIALEASSYDCGFGDGFYSAICATSSGTTFAADVTGVFTNSLIAAASLSPTSMHAALHSLPAPAKVRGQYIPGGAGVLIGVRFDDFTVSGPSPTVQIGVSIHSEGSADRIAGSISRAVWGVAIGFRNPASFSCGCIASDFLGGKIVRDGGTFFSTSSGPDAASVNQTATGVFTANVGSPFELGYEFDLLGFQSNIAFGNTFSVDFSVPDGYTLTSRGGLSVNVAPVPEPSTYALLVAGLLTIGAIARRRTH